MATAGIIGTDQNQRSSTLHPHRGGLIDPACWYCLLRPDFGGPPPSRPYPDLDSSFRPWLISLLASLLSCRWQLVTTLLFPPSEVRLLECECLFRFVVA